jgi:hypothetical protein
MRCGRSISADIRQEQATERRWSTMNMGFAWYAAMDAVHADRPESGHCCSDRDYFRALGVDVDAKPKKHPLQRRSSKLVAAIPASLSVFRELMRRPAGATVVILVPRTERPSAPDGVTVIDERELRDAS